MKEVRKQKSSFPLFSMFLAFSAGFLLVVWGFTLQNTRQIDYATLADCAQGQDVELRETSGVAPMRVDFSDGKVTKVYCDREAL